MNVKQIYASIITVGDELLIGQVVDTNSTWMAAELNKAGVWLRRRVAVGDNCNDIIKALDEESRDTDIILITGGLGPTSDDITKPVLCEYFGGRLIVDEGALENVKQIFSRLNRPMIASNYKQAEVPDVCTVIPNKRGTAPGMWFEKTNKIYVSMPGVPHEMKGMMTDYVLPRLPQFFNMPAIVSNTLLTAGIGESFLSEKVKDFETNLPPHIKLAYLPNYGMVRLRLTGIGAVKEIIASEVNAQFQKMKQLVEEHLVTDEDDPIQVVISKIFKKEGMTLSTAESCTGGYIAHLLTSEPGASLFFKGSIVSYANEAKQYLLNVSENTLQTDGAVSEATVSQMVKGALSAMKTDYAVAVSGIMGPDGGSAEKPVGLVWIAVGNHLQTVTQKFNFRFDRRRNIELTANNALTFLRRFVLSQGM